MKDVLISAWQELEENNDLYSLNSEHAFQAIMYHLLFSRLVTKKQKIFIEPWLGKQRPDIMVTELDIIKCIAEIKYSPHNRFNNYKTKNDIVKLSGFSKKDHYDLWYYNKHNAFDVERQKWGGVRPSYKVNRETIYCFMVIGHEKDKTIYPDYLFGELPKDTQIHKLLLFIGLAKHNTLNNTSVLELSHKEYIL